MFLSSQTIAVAKAVSPAVAGGELALRKDVAEQALLYLLAGGTGRNVELAIESVQGEHVTVRGVAGRAGATVARFAEVVAALPGAVRELGEFCKAGR